MNKLKLQPKKLLFASGILIGSFVYLYALYKIFKFYINSDMANLLLEANDIANGNLFLSNWVLTGISFLTTDMLFFVIGTAFFGVSLKAINVALALMVFVFCLSSLPLLDWRNKKTAIMSFFIWLSIGAIPVGVAQVALIAHTALWIYVFVSCFYIERIFNGQYAGKRKKHLIIIALCLALGVIGDAVILIGCVIPIIVVCFYLFLVDSNKKEFSVKLFITTVAGTVFGLLGDKAYFLIGGADKMAFLSNVSFKHISNISDSFILYLRGLLGLFDADFSGRSVINPITFLYFLRVLIIILSFFIITKNIIQFFRKKNDDIVSVILSIGFVLLSLVYILTTLSVDINTTRYYAYVPILFAILICRFFMRFEILNLRITRFKISSLSFVVPICVILIIGITNFIMPKKWIREPDNSYERLSDFLISNDLKYGYSGFWDASITTVTSGEKVKIRAILSNGNVIHPYYWFCKEDWYKEETNFVVINDGYGGITENNIINILGFPYQKLEFENFVIYIYERNIQKNLRYVINAPVFFPNNLGHTLTISPSEKLLFSQFDDFLSTGSGFVVYGPYRSINAGIYEAVFRYDYHGDLPENIEVGYVDCFFGATTIKYIPFFSGNNQVTLRFTIENYIENCELRMYAHVDGVKFLSMEIELWQLF